jgi:apoptotic chromatin condensation inducer in the nucleus
MLEDVIKELKDQIAEEEKKEDEKPEEPAQEEPVKEEVKAEEKPAGQTKIEEPKSEEQKPVEQPKPEEKPEEKPDAMAFQRLRREEAAAKKRADALEAEIAALKAAPLLEEQPKTERDPEVEEVKQELRTRKAEREFQSLEQKFARTQPDYEAVSAEYAMALAQSIRIQNPRLSVGEVAEKTKDSLLRKAASYMRDGFDPIEELFHEAKELGFTGASFRKQAPAKEEAKATEEEIAPDMKKVAANRARSTGMTGASGKSEGQMTKQAAADLSVQEWQKLPQAEKRRLMYG